MSSLNRPTPVMIQGCDLSIWIGPIKCNSTTVNSTRSYIQTDLCCWVNHESQVNCPLNTLFQASAGFSSHWKLISPPIGYFGICSNLFFHTIFFVGEKNSHLKKKNVGIVTRWWDPRYWALRIPQFHLQTSFAGIISLRWFTLVEGESIWKNTSKMLWHVEGPY